MSDAHDDLQLQLQALFLDELQDGVRILTDGLRQLAPTSGGAADAGLLQTLFRAAHSLKGAAHSAGATAAVEPCRRLENVLSDLRAGERPVDAAVAAELLADVDALAALEPVLRAELSTSAPAVGARGAGGDEPVMPQHSSDARSRARIPIGRLDELVHRAAAAVTATGDVAALAATLSAMSSDAVATKRRGRRASGEVEHRGRWELGDELSKLTTWAAAVDRRVRRTVSEVAELAQELRLQSFEDVVAGLDRAVREASTVAGVETRLVTDGGDVRLDRNVGDAVREPLIHLVRNAVAHGIETPQDRVDAGKPREGTVSVSAVDGGMDLLIAVTDDGRGLDLAALQSSAQQLGHAVPEDATELAFVPGLSTVTEVTDLSGRGVGLDAVRSKVESLGGSVRVRSERGAGTTVEMRVPRTLAVMGVLVADAGGGHLVALPSASVARLHRVAPGTLDQLGGRLHVRIGERRVPAVSLAAALARSTAELRDGTPQIALEIEGEARVLLVVGVETELDIVLQPAPSRLGAQAGALGTTVLPSGRAALVVNPAAMLRVEASATTAAPTARRERHVVLLAEDTLTTRALMRSILDAAGYEVVIAVDGADAWRQLSERTRAVDLLVTDVDMPRMSGIELCRRVRSAPGLTGLPVVLVTSLATDEDRRRGLEAGANAYIVKSAFDQGALLDAIRSLL